MFAFNTDLIVNLFFIIIIISIHFYCESRKKLGLNLFLVAGLESDLHPSYPHICMFLEQKVPAFISIVQLRYKVAI